METLPELDLPLAPGWSLGLGTLGRVLVVAGLASYLASALGWLLAGKRPRLGLVGAWGFWIGTACLVGTFAVLGSLFILNRFEYSYVFGHGDKRNAIAYRIAGIWSGQEGSFLLWATTSALFGALAVRSTGAYRRWFTIPYSLFLAVLCGILAYESPFRIQEFHGKIYVPPDGVGLTPALQNYWVIIHPPTIFLGFGSLTVLFAHAFAALASRNPFDWARMVRPWALVSLTLVGLGLCMGGLWAYETLGWGGFWAWDPVENTSLVPWLFTAVLVHGLIVQVNRGRWIRTNLLFGGLPFLAFVYGTFLTRSGLLGDTSVHSFAEMDNKALKLLVGLFFVATILFCGLWVVRSLQLRKELAAREPERAGWTRESAYRLGLFLVFGLAIATAFGMSVPMLSSLFGLRMKVVGEAQYHQVVSWFFVPIALFLAAAPFVSWGGISIRRLLGRLYGPACVAFGLVGLTLLVLAWSPWGRLGPFEEEVRLFFGALRLPALTWTLILTGLCFFIVTANLWTIGERVRTSREAIAIYLSHVGVGLTLAGLLLSRGLERKERVVAQQGTPQPVLGYAMNVKGPNRDYSDRDNKVRIDMRPMQGKGAFEARPGFYFVTRPNGTTDPMAWPHVQRMATHDVYLTVHGISFDATEVTPVKLGQTIRFLDFDVTYNELTREGEAGVAGTKFGAKLSITSEGRTYSVHPKVVLGEGGLRPEPVLLGDEHFLTMEGMNAADKTAMLQLHYMRPVFPIEVFYKPFTSLVWGGLGILTLGGFLAAWNRRNRPRKPPEMGTAEVESEPAHDEAHALAPTA